MPPLPPPRKRPRILDPERLPALPETPRLISELAEDRPEGLGARAGAPQVLGGEFDQHPAGLEAIDRLPESFQSCYLRALNIHLHRVDPFDLSGGAVVVEGGEGDLDGFGGLGPQGGVDAVVGAVRAVGVEGDGAGVISHGGLVDLDVGAARRAAFQDLAAQGVRLEGVDAALRSDPVGEEESVEAEVGADVEDHHARLDLGLEEAALAGLGQGLAQHVEAGIEGTGSGKIAEAGREEQPRQQAAEAVDEGSATHAPLRSSTMWANTASWPENGASALSKPFHSG